MVYLTMALNEYDRTFPILTGNVGVEGTDLKIHTLHPRAILDKIRQSSEFDIFEMPFTSYLVECAKGNGEFIGIPVFPSRLFCHSFLYVRGDSRILAPEQLKGKRVGIVSFEAPEVFWLRALLKEDYGLDYTDITWIESPEASLPDKLLNEDLEAIITIQNVRPLLQEMKVKRLFSNAVSAEKQYYREKKIFPIFSTVAIRKSAVDRYPELPKTLFAAMEASKEIAMADLRMTVVVKSNNPWQFEGYEEAIRVMGNDIWPYGMNANRQMLEQATRYAFEQGIIDKLLHLDNIYPPF